MKPKEEDHLLNSKSVVVEMDDNIDEEMIAVLLEPNYVENFALCNTEVRNGVESTAVNLQLVAAGCQCGSDIKCTICHDDSSIRLVICTQLT